MFNFNFANILTLLAFNSNRPIYTHSFSFEKKSPAYTFGKMLYPNIYGRCRYEWWYTKNLLFFTTNIDNLIKLL